MSLMGCSGLEWNILECSDEEIETVRQIVGVYKRYRSLLHSGVLHHADFKEKRLRARGVSAADGSRAVWTIASTDVLHDSFQERLRIPGLRDDHNYCVKVIRDIGDARWGWVVPQWLTLAMSEEGFTVSGLLLREVGLQLPTLWPLQAVMLDIQAQ
ncbi:GH36 C-terminal domain-containing protein [Alloscardovia omnicolens]|uniref:GH36 C-terminal domain-containing protein n=1 Tax=Alloscardovia omnicolens TaxID=419015 RepID=UPI003A73071C